MASDPHNRQYDTDGPQLVPGNYASTNAPGSVVAGPESTAGPDVGTVEVNPTGLPDGSGLGRQPVTVTAGDTSGMSSDNPINASAFQGDPGPQMSTGAGQGHADNFRRRDYQQTAGD